LQDSFSAQKTEQLQCQIAAHAATMTMQHWSRIPTSFYRQLCKGEGSDVRALFILVLEHNRRVPKVIVHNIKSKSAWSCNWRSAMKPCKGESAASDVLKVTQTSCT